MAPPHRCRGGSTYPTVAAPPVVARIAGLVIPAWPRVSNDALALFLIVFGLSGLLPLALVAPAMTARAPLAAGAVRR